MTLNKPHPSNTTRLEEDCDHQRYVQENEKIQLAQSIFPTISVTHQIIEVYNYLTIMFQANSLVPHGIYNLTNLIKQFNNRIISCSPQICITVILIRWRL